MAELRHGILCINILNHITTISLFGVTFMNQQATKVIFTSTIKISLHSLPYILFGHVIVNLLFFYVMSVQEAKNSTKKLREKREENSCWISIFQFNTNTNHNFIKLLWHASHKRLDNRHANWPTGHWQPTIIILP